MTRLDLYKLALAQLDMTISSLEDDTKERRLLDLFYNASVTFCLKAYDFPFLVKKEKLTDRLYEESGEPKTWNGFPYCYALPDGFGSAVQLDGSKMNPYAIRFGTLWCDAPEPTLEYMPDGLEEDEDGVYAAPDDFMALVAYQLVLHTAPTLDPDGKAMATAAQLYQLTLSSIIENDTRTNDRPLNWEADGPWDGSAPFVTQATLKEMIVRGDA
jgi:hypothetical protein